ncbi:MAG: hypothetical protein JRI41_06080 [Deltaproteobacteria bacterium]|nr:hypothetical protein [Deltaproteobacteria bacterium]
MYENDEKDPILLGQGLLADAIFSFREGVGELIDDERLTVKGRALLERIRDLASKLNALEKRYRSTLREYEDWKK